MTNRLCMNCKHFAPDEETWGPGRRALRHAACGRTAYVTGPDGKECSDERAPRPLWQRVFGPKTCGPEARFFEPKEA